MAGDSVGVGVGVGVTFSREVVQGYLNTLAGIHQILTPKQFINKGSPQLTPPPIGDILTVQRFLEAMHSDMAKQVSDQTPKEEITNDGPKDLSGDSVGDTRDA